MHSGGAAEPPLVLEEQQLVSPGGRLWSQVVVVILVAFVLVVMVVNGRQGHGGLSLFVDLRWRKLFFDWSGLRLSGASGVLIAFTLYDCACSFGHGFLQGSLSFTA